MIRFPKKKAKPVITEMHQEIIDCGFMGVLAQINLDYDHGLIDNRDSRIEEAQGLYAEMVDAGRDTKLLAFMLYFGQIRIETALNFAEACDLLNAVAEMKVYSEALKRIS